MSTTLRFTVFTKPWPGLTLDELGEMVARMGFQGVELPVRPGYQVEPDHALTQLPKAAETLKKHGVDLVSVAGPCNESMVRACGEAGHPLLRIMVKVPTDTDYLAHLENTQRGWDALLPTLESSGVTLGVQNHKQRFLTHAMHLYHAVARYDRKQIGAVWDAAHEAFAGSDPELALDVVWSHLCLVNLKNGRWEPDGKSDLGVAKWRPRWVAGHEGLCDWPRVARELSRRGYTGDVCLTAEYSEPAPARIGEMVQQDLTLARLCFSSGQV